MVNSTELWQFIDFACNVVWPLDSLDNCSLQYRSAFQQSWTLVGSENGYYLVPDGSVCGSSLMTSKDVESIEWYKKRFYFAMTYGGDWIKDGHGKNGFDLLCGDLKRGLKIQEYKWV